MDYLHINKNDDPNDIKKSQNEACITQMSPAQLDQTLTVFEQKWKLDSDDVQEHFDEKFVKNTFEIGSVDDLDASKINAKLTMPLEFLADMHNRCVTGNFFNDDPRELGVPLGFRINRAIKVIASWKLALVNKADMLDMMKPGGAFRDIEFNPDNILAPSTYNPDKHDGNNDYQNCIIYVLNRLKSAGYKRY